MHVLPGIVIRNGSGWTTESLRYQIFTKYWPSVLNSSTRTVAAYGGVIPLNIFSALKNEPTVESCCTVANTCRLININCPPFRNNRFSGQFLHLWNDLHWVGKGVELYSVAYLQHKQHRHTNNKLGQQPKYSALQYYHVKCRPPLAKKIEKGSLIDWVIRKVQLWIYA